MKGPAEKGLSSMCEVIGSIAGIPPTLKKVKISFCINNQKELLIALGIIFTAFSISCYLSWVTYNFIFIFLIWFFRRFIKRVYVSLPNEEVCIFIFQFFIEVKASTILTVLYLQLCGIAILRTVCWGWRNSSAVNSTDWLLFRGTGFNY